MSNNDNARIPAEICLHRGVLLDLKTERDYLLPAENIFKEKRTLKSKLCPAFLRKKTLPDEPIESTLSMFVSETEMKKKDDSLLKTSPQAKEKTRKELEQEEIEKGIQSLKQQIEELEKEFEKMEDDCKLITDGISDLTKENEIMKFKIERNQEEIELLQNTPLTKLVILFELI